MWCAWPCLENRNGAFFPSASWPGRELPGGTVCVWLTLALSHRSKTEGVWRLRAQAAQTQVCTSGLPFLTRVSSRNSPSVIPQGYR